MKKTLSIILCLVMVLSLVAVSISAAPKADSVGKVAASYKPEGTGIASLAEITDPAGKYYLTKDITVTETFATEFTGTFDGNGKTITTSVALFNKVNNATIKNIIVKGEINLGDKVGVKQDGTEAAASDNNFVAAVANVANGSTTFKNILSEVDISATSAKTRAAAIAGTSEADYNLTIDTCVNKGDVSLVSYAGGVYGWTANKGSAVITNCANYGAITATDGYVGGVANRISGSAADQTVKITNCANYGAITATGADAGGILAYHNKAALEITNCVNEGTIVNNTAGKRAAGILSCADSCDVTITNCVNKGKVNSPNTKYAAGMLALIGKEGNKIEITNCKNEADIISGGVAGGIGGWIKLTDADSSLVVKNCTNKGNVDSSFATAKEGHAAGILAYCNYTTTISNCLNYGDVKSSTAGANFAGGIAGKPGTNASTILIEYCGNYGNVYGGSNAAVSGSSGTAGVSAYLYGGNNSSTMQYCFNAGKVEALSAAGSAAGLIGYTNTGKVITIQYCYNTGDIVLAKDSTGTKCDLFWNKAATLNLEGIKDNMQREGQTGYLYNEGKDSTNVTTFAAADAASGKLCHDLNTAIGKDVFKQTLGKDAVPSFTGKTVLKNVDGTYSNPETPATGDMTVVLFLVAVATLGSAVVIGKKVSAR